MLDFALLSEGCLVNLVSLPTGKHDSHIILFCITGYQGIGCPGAPRSLSRGLLTWVRVRAMAAALPAPGTHPRGTVPQDGLAQTDMQNWWCFENAGMGFLQGVGLSSCIPTAPQAAYPHSSVCLPEPSPQCFEIRSLYAHLDSHERESSRGTLCTHYCYVPVAQHGKGKRWTRVLYCFMETTWAEGGVPMVGEAGGRQDGLTEGGSGFCFSTYICNHTDLGKHRRNSTENSCMPFTRFPKHFTT